MRRVETLIRECGRIDKPWCLRWQTDSMPAPAFWYFETLERAQHEERCLKEQIKQKDMR